MNGAPDLATQDRRRECRRAAAGRVTLAFEDPFPRRLDAELVDVSASGFRCRHRCGELRTGQAVRFRHPAAEGEARVMWTRIAASGIESGFLLL